MRSSHDEIGLDVWVPTLRARTFVSDILARAQKSCEEAKAVNIRIIEGYDDLREAPTDSAVLFYLAKEGLSRDLYEAARRRGILFFFRFFSEEQLFQGEVHSIEDIWNQVFSEFPPDEQCAGRAFLGWKGDPESEQAFFAWFCSVIDFLAAQKRLGRANQTLKALYAESLTVWTEVSTRKCRMSFGAVLALAAVGSSWRNCLQESSEDAVASRLKCRELNGMRARSAHQEYEKNVRRKNPRARVARWPLGGQYEPLLTKLDDLTDKLLSSGHASISALGVTLSSLMRATPPTLAVVGAFSSGKTTLLNSVLLGERPGCAFRTRHTANTSIVYDIVSCGVNQPESVEFIFCEEVEHPLYDAHGDGETWGKYRKMFLELLDAQILMSPEICFETSSYVFHYREARARDFLAQQDQDQARRIVEREITERFSAGHTSRGGDFLERNKIKRAIFQATATENQDLLNSRLSQLGLPKHMNLVTPDDWTKFQGQHNDGAGPATESDLVSILVKKAVVRLNSPLLRMTSIADTPGTGSSRDRHDYISERYIDHSEAFILLLRTGGDQYSKRVVKILKRIAQKFSASGVSALPRVAFVINVDHKAEAPLDGLSEYLELTAVELGMMPHEFQKQAHIFAVDLKNSEVCGTNFLGYPSLADLSKWVSGDVFTLAAYRERLAKIRALLSEQWNTTTKILKKKLHDGEMSRVEKQKQTVMLRSLVDDLEALCRRFLSYVSDPLSEIESGRDRILGQVKSYTERAYSKDDLNRLHDSVVQSLRDINSIAHQATELDPAECWIEEVQPLVAGCFLLMPGLRPPDRREAHFEQGLQVNIERVERKFKKIHERWPNLLRRLWDWGASFFGGEDLRCHLAWKLQETLREELEVVAGTFQGYHSRCSAFFKETGDEICKQRDERLKFLDDEISNSTSTLEAELAEIQSFQQTRKNLLLELEKFLAGDAKERRKKTTTYGQH